MSVRERILAIQLMEMQERHPEYAENLGIKVKMEEKGNRKEEEIEVTKI
ncbi:MAG: hypothetical protein J6J15_04070 [Oscillospiraceae bacterium]|nr:hypothetical protein [Oscillospiraceae bacterium]